MVNDLESGLGPAGIIEGEAAVLGNLDSEGLHWLLSACKMEFKSSCEFQ